METSTWDWEEIGIKTNLADLYRVLHQRGSRPYHLRTAGLSE